KNPTLRDWLEENWSRAGLAVEEFLRFVSPVQFSKPRFARGHGAWRSSVEKGGQNHGHGGGSQYGPAGKRPSRTARPSATTEPALLIRNRHPFLPWPSACTHRRHVRPSSAVHALAKTPPGGGARPNPLAQAARPQVDRKTARCGRPLMTACGTFYR